MSKSQNYKKTSILGVEIDIATQEQAAGDIVAYASASRPAAYITKPYVEFLDAAAGDKELQNILNNSLLTLPDSVALQWSALYLSKSKSSLPRLFISLALIIINPKSLSKIIPERFAGADFCWLMLEKAAAYNLSVYLIGSPKGSNIDQTVIAIKKRLPKINIVGTFDGYAVNTEENELVRELRNIKPQLILVGTGFPRQEILMARLSHQLENGLMVGEGGTFDYDSFGGNAKRAPKWMRKIGLEWLWRLVIEPKRIKRQLAIPRFIWKIYRSAK